MLNIRNQITSIFRKTPVNNVNDKLINNTQNYLLDGDDIKWEDTTPFSFPIQGGRVIKVYDGDTITIASKLPYENSPLFRLSVRLNGIDTPEIKGKTEDEKTVAKQVKTSTKQVNTSTKQVKTGTK